MLKKICRQCGSALTEGARFCTNCGAMVGAETAGVISLETRPLSREQPDQTSPSNASATEALPSNRTDANRTAANRTAAPKEPSDYDTEEFPQTRTTAQVEERSTMVVADAPATQPRVKSPSANRPSGGRKGLLPVAALGIAALAAGSFFLVNSRRSSETQTVNQPAGESDPAASAPGVAQPSIQSSIRPSDQPSGGAANNQAQPQTAPTIEIKSPAGQTSEIASKPPQTRSESKPASAVSQEKKAADGTGAAEHNVSQGVTYMNAGRYQEALQEFEYVKKLDPGNKSVYYLIGQTYHKMNQLDRALEAYRQCTSGVYASVAQSNVKMLEKKLGRTN